MVDYDSRILRYAPTKYTHPRPASTNNVAKKKIIYSYKLLYYWWSLLRTELERNNGTLAGPFRSVYVVTRTFTHT